MHIETEIQVHGAKAKLLPDCVHDEGEEKILGYERQHKGGGGLQDSYQHHHHHYHQHHHCSKQLYDCRDDYQDL